MSALAIEIAEQAEARARYFRLRAVNPDTPARHLFAYANGDGDGEALNEYLCRVGPGHQWGYSGAAYGGDDERFHGEGRVLCNRCGADGDA